MIGHVRDAKSEFLNPSSMLQLEQVAHTGILLRHPDHTEGSLFDVWMFENQQHYKFADF